MTRLIKIHGFCLSILFTLNTQASVITAGGTALTSPDVYVNFSADLYPAGTAITTEFSAYGVSFSSNIADGWAYETHGAPVDGQDLGHVQRGTTTVDYGTFSINFAGVVTDALFNFRAFSGNEWTLRSLLAGSVVETTIFTGSFPTSNSLYGFINSSFDEIQITNLNADAGFEIDNLQYNAVPEPTALILLGLGLLGMGFGRRQRVQARPT